MKEMRAKLILATAIFGAAVVLAAGGSALAAARPAAAATVLTSQNEASIVGTWVSTVTSTTPGPPPFVATVVFTSSNNVIEASNKPLTPPTTFITSGLGVWDKLDGASSEATFQIYAFNSSGAYIGKTVVVETDTLKGADTYNGKATATIYDAADHVLAILKSTTHAVRMHM